MMIVGIYDPYFPILGGAEMYVLAIAKCLEGSYKIYLFANDSSLVSKAFNKFGIKLDNVEVKPWIINRKERNNLLKDLDLFFYVTDGSIFYSPAKKNYLIIQTPFHIPQKNITNKLKLLSWKEIICYSDFMERFIQKQLGKKAEVLFVPIDNVESKISNKKNVILSVGRFFPHLHNKKQLEMIMIFRKLVKDGFRDVQLILVGSIDPGAEEYFNKVKKAAEGLPVDLVTDADHKKLTEYYSQAKIYWHATGYGENLEIHPEKAEAFGVTTLEATNYGCVPVVFAGGGQTEIVTDGFNGFIWKNSEQLKKYTTEILKNEKLREKLSAQAVKSSKEYSIDKFCERLQEIINK